MNDHDRGRDNSSAIYTFGRRPVEVGPSGAPKVVLAVIDGDAPLLDLLDSNPEVIDLPSFGHAALLARRVADLRRPEEGVRVILTPGFFPSDPGLARIDQISGFYFELFQTLVRSKCPVDIVAWSEEDNAISGLVEGLARAVSTETTLITYRTLMAKVTDVRRAPSLIGQAFATTARRLFVDGGRLHAQTIERADLGAKFQPGETLRGGENFVVIGGGGGIGRRLSAHLTQGYGGKVFVIGRGELTPDRRQDLRRSAVGAYLRADIRNERLLRQTFDHIHTEFGRIAGVFHLAGHLDDDRIVNLSPSRFAAVLGPKVEGTLNLAKVCDDLAIEFVCCFSSLSSILGHVGQSSYAAANGFMDAFCRTARASNHRTRWLSINWGLWQAGGMSMTLPSNELNPMASSDALEKLDLVLSTGLSQAVIFSGSPSLVASDAPRAAEANSAAERPVGDPAPDARAAVARWLISLVEKFSGIPAIPVHTSFIDAGLDSVALINIASAIEARVRRAHASFKLNKAVLFDYPTIDTLTEHLWGTTFVHAPQLVQDLFGAQTEVSGASAPAQRLPPQSRPNREPEPVRDTDVAIIGVAGEFPGADSFAELWKVLRGGGCPITVIPGERWDWRRDYHPERQKPGTTYGRHGGFLPRAMSFDADFFGVTPREALTLDPQERRFLTIAYSALEDSGHFAAPHASVGVFAAAMFGHYQNFDPERALLNSSFASIANRVSFALDLKGPSLTVDTMCSGSLTALHLAISALNASDCAVAIAGAVNIMPHPGKYKVLSRGNFLSPTGRCQSFGIDADGYVPGEGTVAFVLKSHARAVRDGDRIYAVVKGSAVNAGGRTSAYTVPSSHAQSAVITQALQRAGIAPAQVGYVEAHGTGTALGDPIEIKGLREGYGANESTSCVLGSIKSNIGHLESAAGFAGLAKIILQFQHDTIAPTLHCDIENPELHIDQTRFRLAKRAVPYPSDQVRYAGLSSFGAGGSCGHVIVRDHPSTAPAVNASRAEFVIPVSAKSSAALLRVQSGLADHLSNHPDLDPYALGYTLARARRHFAHRRCFVVRTVAELIQRLRDRDTTPSDHAPVNLTDLQRRFSDGENIDFEQIYPEKRLVSLPPYSFETTRYEVDFGAAPIPVGPSAANEADPPVPPTIAAENTPLFFVPRPLPAPVSRADELSTSARWIVLHDGAPPRRPPNGVEINALNFATSDGSLDFAGFSKRLTEHIGASDDARIHLAVMPLPKVAIAEHARLHFELARALIRTKRSIAVLFVHRDSASPDDVYRASVHALYKNLGVETSRISTHLVELGRDEAPAWSDLAAEVTTNATFSHALYTSGGRQEVASHPIRLDPAAGPRIESGDVILVSGGLGKLGRRLCRTLIERYDARVAIVGRSPATARIDELVRQISPDHARYISADLRRRDDCVRAVATVKETFGRIDGVIHAAAVLNDGLFENKTFEDFTAVIDVKRLGAEHLDEATQHESLRYFVLFSSIASVFGNVGQSDYVIANSFLDRFARYRNDLVRGGRRRGHTLSINWPLWLEDQSSASDPMEQFRTLSQFMFKTFGFRPVSGSRGIEQFFDLLNGAPSSVDQCLPLAGDDDRIRVAMAHLHRTQRADQPSPDATAVTARVRDVVARVTGLDAGSVAFDQNFGDLGMNSVMLQELADQLTSSFGVEIAPISLFRYNTVGNLAQYLVRQSSAAPAVAVAPATTTKPRPDRRTAKQDSPGFEANEAFAIIGMNGRMPGSLDLGGFWQLLEANDSAIVPIDRWPHARVMGGLIPNYDHFDPKFFGMSPREAKLIDPQHRLFLQTAYNTFLDAGYNPRRLKHVGVFCGVQFSDYQTLLQRSKVLNHPFAATGNAHAMLANRVSYLWNFDGPSQTVDTACSSSFVALRNAFKSIRAGECEVALVGAVSLLLDADVSAAAASMGVLSPNSRCATFDAAADGYVRAEGVGAVLVKPYRNAVHDQDAIHAVIVASSENHGGKAHSLTAPNPEAQTELLLRAYTPELARRVTYVEAHGTGTKLGDPIEVDALKTAWRRLGVTSAPGSVAIGSVKSNVGHLEPAAGMASLFKVILAMKHGKIPATIHVENTNPMIRLDESPFEIATINREWNPPGPRVAGISSFGFGGANTHVVVSEAAPVQRQVPVRAGTAGWLITLSAKSTASLRETALGLARVLRASPPGQVTLADVAFTLNTGREDHDIRHGWVVAHLAELIAHLETTDWTERCRCTPVDRTFGVDPADPEHAHRALAAYLAGQSLEWAHFHDRVGGHRIHLPGYVFDESPFWFEG